MPDLYHIYMGVMRLGVGLKLEHVMQQECKKHLQSRNLQGTCIIWRTWKPPKIAYESLKLQAKPRNRVTNKKS